MPNTEFETVVRGRRMTRAFRPDLVAPALVDSLVDLARRGPSAGNTGSPDFLVLEGSATARYWDLTLPPDRRTKFPWPQLLTAPVLIVPWVNPERYVARYREPDKAHTDLGNDAANWTVPYWFVDGGAAAMTLLLAAEAAGLGALLFGLFEDEDAVRHEFGVPNDLRAVGAIAVGHAAPDRPSVSAARRRQSLGEVIHRGTW